MGAMYVAEGEPDRADLPEDMTASINSASITSVVIDGQDYPVAEMLDVDGDGNPDTAVVESDSGGYIAFTDVDHDGDADLMVELDEHGVVLSAARFDQTTGEWVPVDPGDLSDGESESEPSAVDS